MDRLEEYREKINEIDKQMAILFKQRMEIVSNIAKVKQENNLPIYDQGREAFVMIRNGAYIEDSIIRKYYFDVLSKELEVSKRYQEEILKKG